MRLQETRNTAVRECVACDGELASCLNTVEDADAAAAFRLLWSGIGLSQACRALMGYAARAAELCMQETALLHELVRPARCAYLPARCFLRHQLCIGVGYIGRGAAGGARGRCPMAVRQARVMGAERVQDLGGDVSALGSRIAAALLATGSVLEAALEEAAALKIRAGQLDKYRAEEYAEKATECEQEMIKLAEEERTAKIGCERATFCPYGFGPCLLWKTDTCLDAVRGLLSHWSFLLFVDFSLAWLFFHAFS